VLELFRATAHLDEDLLVLCDSQYVINSVTKWMPGWKKKGWRKADGKPVMNLELLQEIDEALVGRKYRFEWVKGHANHPLNEAADARARAVSEAYQRNAPIPEGPGWTKGGTPAARPAAAARTSARVEAPVAQPVSKAAAKPAAGPSHPGLFDFDDLSTAEPQTSAHSVTLRLSSSEFTALTQKAAARGVSSEDYLRSLI
jgi:ribonuclease HI